MERFKQVWPLISSSGSPSTKINSTQKALRQDTM